MQNQNKKLNSEVDDGLKILHKLRARDKSDNQAEYSELDKRIANC